MADFINAIKRPDIAFKGLRPDLIGGKPVLNKQGKPRAARGGFGCVLKFETLLPHKIWAIKCYNVLPPEIDIHYREVETYLASSAIAHYFLEISFSKSGIRCDGKVYPILKMEWAQGSDLRTFLSKNLNDSYKLKSLAEEWLKLCQLLTQYGVAHGDLQHENVYVIEENGKIWIKLIDYDSLYLTSSGKVVKDIIKGVEGYQHPQRPNINNRCIEIDYFSHLCIYLSILALAEDASLWRSLNLHTEEKKDNLLFSLKDFENPRASDVFTTLSSRFSPEIARLVHSLEKMCLADIYVIPDLSTVTVSHYSASVPQLLILGQLNIDKFVANKPTKQKVIWKPTIKPSKMQQYVPNLVPSRQVWQPKPPPKNLHISTQPSNPAPSPTSFRSSKIKFPVQSSRKSRSIPSKARQSLLMFFVATGATFFAFQGVPIVFNVIQNIVTSIGTVIDNTNEEEIRVKQRHKGKVYKYKILLRKEYIGEFKKHRFMWFWVEYPFNSPLRKTKEGVVNVRYLRLWKYTGRTLPKAHDYAGSVSDATLVPVNGSVSYTQSATPSSQARLIRLSLDET